MEPVSTEEGTAAPAGLDSSLLRPTASSETMVSSNEAGSVPAAATTTVTGSLLQQVSRPTEVLPVSPPKGQDSVGAPEQLLEAPTAAAATAAGSGSDGASTAATAVASATTNPTPTGAASAMTSGDPAVVEQRGREAGQAEGEQRQQQTPTASAEPMQGVTSSVDGPAEGEEETVPMEVGETQPTQQATYTAAMAGGGGQGVVAAAGVAGGGEHSAAVLSQLLRPEGDWRLLCSSRDLLRLCVVEAQRPQIDGQPLPPVLVSNDGVVRLCGADDWATALEVVNRVAERSSNQGFVIVEEEAAGKDLTRVLACRHNGRGQARQAMGDAEAAGPTLAPSGPWCPVRVVLKNVRQASLALPPLRPWAEPIELPPGIYVYSFPDDCHRHSPPPPPLAAFTSAAPPPAAVVVPAAQGGVKQQQQLEMTEGSRTSTPLVASLLPHLPAAAAAALGADGADPATMLAAMLAASGGSDGGGGGSTLRRRRSVPKKRLSKVQETELHTLMEGGLRRLTPEEEEAFAARHGLPLGKVRSAVTYRYTKSRRAPSPLSDTQTPPPPALRQTASCPSPVTHLWSAPLPAAAAGSAVVAPIPSRASSSDPTLASAVGASRMQILNYQAQAVAPAELKRPGAGGAGSSVRRMSKGGEDDDDEDEDDDEEGSAAPMEEVETGEEEEVEDEEADRPSPLLRRPAPPPSSSSLLGQPVSFSQLERSLQPYAPLLHPDSVGELHRLAHDLRRHGVARLALTDPQAVAPIRAYVDRMQRVLHGGASASQEERELLEQAKRRGMRQQEEVEEEEEEDDVVVPQHGYSEEPCRRELNLRLRMGPSGRQDAVRQLAGDGASAAFASLEQAGRLVVRACGAALGLEQHELETRLLDHWPALAARTGPVWSSSCLSALGLDFLPARPTPPTAAAAALAGQQAAQRSKASGAPPSTTRSFPPEANLGDPGVLTLLLLHDPSGRAVLKCRRRGTSRWTLLPRQSSQQEEEGGEGPAAALQVLVVLGETLRRATGGALPSAERCLNLAAPTDRDVTRRCLVMAFRLRGRPSAVLRPCDLASRVGVAMPELSLYRRPITVRQLEQRCEHGETLPPPPPPRGKKRARAADHHQQQQQQQQQQQHREPEVEEEEEEDEGRSHKLARTGPSEPQPAPTPAERRPPDQSRPATLPTPSTAPPAAAAAAAAVGAPAATSGGGDSAGAQLPTIAKDTAMSPPQQQHAGGAGLPAPAAGGGGDRSVVSPSDASAASSTTTTAPPAASGGGGDRRTSREAEKLTLCLKAKDSSTVIDYFRVLPHTRMAKVAKALADLITAREKEKDPDPACLYTTRVEILRPSQQQEEEVMVPVAAEDTCATLGLGDMGLLYYSACTIVTKTRQGRDAAATAPPPPPVGGAASSMPQQQI